MISGLSYAEILFVIPQERPCYVIARTFLLYCYDIPGLPDSHSAIGSGLRGAAEGAVLISYDDLAAAEFQAVDRNGNFMPHACQLICRTVPIGMFH